MSTMIPEGKYQAIAVPHDDGRWMVFGEANNEKKTRQVAVRVKITDGEFANTERTWYGFFTEATMNKTLEQCRNFGAQGDDMTAWVKQALTEPVTIVIKHEEYNGKVSEKIAWINRPGGGEMKNQLTENDLVNWAAQMRAKVATVPAIKRAQPNGKPAAGNLDL